MVNLIEQLFPALVGTGYRITSPRDRDYNGIAWAPGDLRNWWWPGTDLEREYWPAGFPRVWTLEIFRDVFATLGYVPCDNEAVEAGYEKVALYANEQGLPTHAARQLPDGRWTSKLGRMEDIEHELRALEGDLYGTVVLLMKRPIPATAAAAVITP